MDGTLENITALINTRAADPDYLDLLCRLAEWIAAEAERLVMEDEE